MPSDTKTTGAASGIGYTAADADALLLKFTADSPILAADIVTLLNGYEDFVSHTHSITDIKVKDNFGNLAGDQTSNDTDTATGNPNGTNAVPTDPTAGVTEITQSLHTTLRNAFNSLRTHTHTWDDN